MHPTAVFALVSGLHHVCFAVDMHLAPEVLIADAAAPALHQVDIIAQVCHHGCDRRIILDALSLAVGEDGVHLGFVGDLRPGTVLHVGIFHVGVDPVQRCPKLLFPCHALLEVLVDKVLQDLLVLIGNVRCPLAVVLGLAVIDHKAVVRFQRRLVHGITLTQTVRCTMAFSI